MVCVVIRYYLCGGLETQRQAGAAQIEYWLQQPWLLDCGTAGDVWQSLFQLTHNRLHLIMRLGIRDLEGRDVQITVRRDPEV